MLRIENLLIKNWRKGDDEQKQLTTIYCLMIPLTFMINDILQLHHMDVWGIYKVEGGNETGSFLIHFESR